MSAIVLPREMSKALTELTGEPRQDIALVLIMREYARHKLAEIEAAMKQFEQKYGMAFEAYKRIWETEEKEEDYTYEREQDFLEWEALATRYARLESSFAWMP